MAVYGYCRVSTAYQAEEGVSLEEQQRRIIGRAMEMGWIVNQTFIEAGISGGIPFVERPEGRRLNKLLRKGDIVIAAKLDRIFRSTIDCLTIVRDFKERGISLWLLDLGGDVSGNGISELILTIMSAVAQWERGRTGERIRDAKRHQRQTGQYLGGRRPFGWQSRDDGKGLVEDPAEQAALATMRRLRAKGRTFSAIIAAVKAEHGITVARATMFRALKEPQS